MIITVNQISETKIKVRGRFVDDSQVINIVANTPPNPPLRLPGKFTELFLNPITQELLWEYADSPSAKV